MTAAGEMGEFENPEVVELSSVFAHESESASRVLRQYDSFIARKSENQKFKQLFEQCFRKSTTDGFP